MGLSVQRLDIEEVLVGDLCNEFSHNRYTVHVYILECGVAPIIHESLLEVYITWKSQNIWSLVLGEISIYLFAIFVNILYLSGRYHTFYCLLLNGYIYFQSYKLT